MRLKSVQVTNYKSVEDSGAFEVKNLTCLVGKNESGKTAVLEALYKLNPIYGANSSFSDTDYPRRRWSEYKERAEENPDKAIETVWELSESQVAEIEAITGPGVLSEPSVRVWRRYGQTNTTWSFPLGEKRAVENVLAESGLSETDRKRLSKHTTIAQLRQHLAGLEEPSAKLAAFRDVVTGQFHVNGLQRTLIALPSMKLPTFVLFRDYDQLPGRMSLQQLKQRRQNDSLEMADRIFLSLLDLVDASPEEIEQSESSEHMIAELEGVSNRLSEEIFEYWSQNQHLEVSFLFGAAHPNDPPPFDSGQVFQTRIRNQRHKVTVNFDERSTGFIWFFSFLVWFSQVRKNYGSNLVILLDEPGLSLHATAQADLLRYMKQRLLPLGQVLYTTHSPFMVDTSDLLSVRTVEDTVDDEGRVLGTKVGDKVLSTDAETVFPLQAALGYDITQSLFIGAHTLLVEGPSDLLYLRWASGLLAEVGQPGLDPRWTITPCGGIDKIGSFLALFAGNELNITVLTDFGLGDKSKVRTLRESELLRAGRVLSIDAYVQADTADIEDLLGYEFYIGLVNRCYGLEGDHVIPIPDEPPAQVVRYIEDAFRTMTSEVPEFDHYRPAAYVLENSADVRAQLPGVETIRERFSRLTADLNAFLPTA